MQISNPLSADIHQACTRLPESSSEVSLFSNAGTGSGRISPLFAPVHMKWCWSCPQILRVIFTPSRNHSGLLQPKQHSRHTEQPKHCLTERIKSFLLTYKIDWFIQPRQNLLTKAVIHRHSEEMGFWNKIRLWTSIAGVQDVANVVLLHQLLGKRGRLGLEKSNGTFGTLQS